MELQQALSPAYVRKTLAKTNLEAYYKDVGDLQPGDLAASYEALGGNSPYLKLFNLVSKHQREVRICKRSKRWWDKELKSQLLQVRELGRGG